MRPEFQQWLRQCPTISLPPERDALARCRRLEKSEGDLEQHFSTDRMVTLLARLEYSREDERSGLAPRHSIKFSEGANIKEGTNSLAAAIRLYLRFRDDLVFQTLLKQPDSSGDMKPVAAPLPRRTVSWPEWKLPGNDELLQLARITIPYIRFLHPDIVRAVVEDNECRREGWSDRLKKSGIDPSLYLWEHSPCAFPGVRRYVGATEIAQYRRKRPVTAAGFANALDVDDNDHPKAIWSFIFRGKPFQNSGPPGYSLAHLADHKNFKDRGGDEFDCSNTPELPWKTLFGLFTSVANSVYTPDHLMRPTDFSFPLRNLIQRKAADLYGSFCNLLPPLWSIRANELGAWAVNAFGWEPPVGTSEHVPPFLKYRSEEMENLLSEGYLRKVYGVDRNGGE